MTLKASLAATGLAALGVGPALAATADVTVVVPQLKVAEYHKPYVAIWLEEPGTPAGRTLAVWYDSDNRENGGQKWLADLRGWWRKSGRDLRMPAAGLTGATRAPGPQRAALNLGPLKPGAYTLVIEAAREEGGRELVRLPFAFSGQPARAAAAGKTELGAVSVSIRP